MYESITSFAGAVPVPVPLRERNGFRIDTDELERLITKRSKLLIINSPHNPSGARSPGRTVRRSPPSSSAITWSC